MGAPRELQTEHVHTETFVAVRILASQRHESFLGKTESLAERPEVLFDQIGIEAIMAGGNRSVGRGDYFTGNARHSRVKTDTFVFHAMTNRFKNCQRAASFVEVKDSRHDAKHLEGGQ